MMPLTIPVSCVVQRLPAPACGWGGSSPRPYHIRRCILFQAYPSEAGRTSESAITCYRE